MMSIYTITTAAFLFSFLVAPVQSMEKKSFENNERAKMIVGHLISDKKIGLFSHPLITYHEVFARIKKSVTEEREAKVALEIFKALPNDFFTHNTDILSPFSHLLGTFLFKNENIFLYEKNDLLKELLLQKRLPEHEAKSIEFIKQNYFNAYFAEQYFKWKDCNIEQNLSGAPIYNSLLYYACRANQEYVAMIALDQGAHPHQDTGFRKDTPLKAAVRCGNSKLVRLLLEHGAPVDSKREEEIASFAQPLHEAVMYNRIAVLEILLEYGADINRLSPLYPYATNSNPIMPIDIAVETGNYPIVKKLLELGAQPSTELCHNPFDVAVKKGLWDIATLLKEKCGAKAAYYLWYVDHMKKNTSYSPQ